MEFSISEKKPVGVLTLEAMGDIRENNFSWTQVCMRERETDPQDSGFRLLVLCTT